MVVGAVAEAGEPGAVGERGGPGAPGVTSRVTVSSSDATPRVRRTRAQSCSRRWTSSHAQESSSAAARRSADQPMKPVSAAEWARVMEAGRSSASSSRSHSWAGSVPNTLPAPLITAGTPASRSASRIIAACRLVRTSTARCAGRTASVRWSRRSPAATRAPELSSATMSPATSQTICRRASAARA